MSEGLYTAVAETSTLGIKGRAVARVRDRNFLVDDPALPQYDNGPGEELGAAELFVAGITACAALMIERIARAESIPYGHCSVHMEVDRDMTATRERGLQVPDAARMHFTWRGISAEHAAFLTEEFQMRCPLYGSLATATPDCVVTHEVVG